MDTTVLIPGISEYKCWEVWSGGRQGVIPRESCNFVKFVVFQTCGCQDIPPEELAELSDSLNLQHVTPDELFTVEFNETGYPI